MTKDGLIWDLARIAYEHQEDGTIRRAFTEQGWPLIAAFVGDWIESQGDDLGRGILPIEAASIAGKWREEMGG